ncbi:MAG TPA: MFS transporter [Candidatus Paceibacterota bacterium]
MQSRIIRQYYVLSAALSFCGLSFLSAVYVSFLMSHGLNLMQVNMVNAVFYLSLFLCEIPTGAFADLYGRKTAFVLSLITFALAKFVYASSDSIWWFMFAEVLAAIAFTFQNGAFQAWFVDSLKHHGYDESFTRLFSTSTCINQVCAGLGALTGSALYQIDTSLPWYAGAFLLGILSIVAYLIMREDYMTVTKVSVSRGLESMGAIARKSIRYATTERTVRFVLIITFVQVLAVQGFNMYWQPFFTERSMDPKHLGTVFCAMMVFLSLGTFIASRMRLAGREKTFIVMSLALVGVTVIGAALAPALMPALIFFLAHEIPRAFWLPLKDGYLHARIPSHERATIASFCSIAPHIGGAIGLLVSGAIAQAFGISAAWSVSGVVLIGGSIMAGRIARTHD